MYRILGKTGWHLVAMMMIMMIMLVVFGMNQSVASFPVKSCLARRRPFASPSSSSSLLIRNDHEVSTTTTTTSTTTPTPTDPPDPTDAAHAAATALWSWNASGSFGSLLLQMQQKEEQALREGQPSPSNELLQPLDLDQSRRHHHRLLPKTAAETSTGPAEAMTSPQPPPQQQSATTTTTTTTWWEPTLEPNEPFWDQMNGETIIIKELDEAILPLSGSSRDDLLAEIKVLSPSSPLLGDLYQAMQQQQLTTTATTTTTTTTLPPLSQPRHYRDRIGRDMRHLAVSVAASTESVAQWRLFCQENGGLYPLLETIREGVKSIHSHRRHPYRRRRQQQQQQHATKGGARQDATKRSKDTLWPTSEVPGDHDQDERFLSSDDATTARTTTFLTRTLQRTKPTWSWWDHTRHEEETFLAACQACRALRDLCAISPELAAVVTDGLLRANAAWNESTGGAASGGGANASAARGGGLMQGFRTKLEYANDVVLNTEAVTSTRTGAAASDEGADPNQEAASSSTSNFFTLRRRNRRDAGLRCKLYVTQLLLAMATASDDAIEAIRSTPGLTDAIVACSSYARKEQRRRWLRYPGELAKYFWRRTTESRHTQNRIRRPFMEAANLANDLNGQVQRTANQVLAAIGYNQWVPKIPGQKGIRILCLDGGGSRGMVAVTALRCLCEYVGNGAEVADSFDLVAGTSTGGIISFLTALRRETSAQASERYSQLIKQIFVKSALSAPRMVFTTASYDESHFMEILSNILRDDTMLDSRSDPSTPFVFCVTSKMSSTPTHVALFRNYNYAKGELADHFTLDPLKAREDSGLPLSLEHPEIQGGHYARKEVSTGSPGVRLTDGSRHPGSFRVLQRYALRASTAAPTVFKPVMMGGEMYCDGGIVASNPAAVAIHEARTLFPDVPIEMVVSVGTGGFLEQKSSPRIGWDGIIGQIVGSACDGEQIHHILEDILGDSSVLGRRSSVSGTRYFRFNPVLGLPDEFPIDVTDPQKLERLRRITEEYMKKPEQIVKMDEIADVLAGGRKWRLWPRRKKATELRASSN